MITQDIAKRARAALQAAVDRPGTVSPDDMDQLSGILEEWHSTSAAAREQKDRSFGENLTAAPTGMEALERSIPVQGEEKPAEVASGVADLKTRLEPILGAQRESRIAASQLTPEASSDDVARMQARFRDPSLPSQSKNPQLYRPPEYWPYHGGETPAQSMMSSQHGVQGLPGLPRALGGDVEHFTEPSVDEFRRDMAGVTANTEGLDQNSDAYQVYADQKWLAAYEQAKAEGRPIVRHEFRKDRNWMDRVVGGATSVMHGVGAFTVGGVRGLTGGLVHGNESVAESHPDIAAAGEVLGTLHPKSIGGLAMKGVEAEARGVGRMLPGQLQKWAAREAATPAGKTLAPLAMGGLKGAAAGVATAGAQAGGEALRGNLPEDWEQRVAIAGALGIPLGGAAELGGAALKGIGAGRVKNLRKDYPALNSLEAAGGGTTPWSLSGVKRGPQLDEALERARQLNPGKPGTPMLLADELVEPVRRAGAETQAAGKASIAGEKEAYFGTPEGRTPQQVTHVTKRAIEMLRGLTKGAFEDTSGADLTGVNQELRRVINSTATPKLVMMSSPMEVAEARAALDAAQGDLARAKSAEAAVERGKLYGSESEFNNMFATKPEMAPRSSAPTARDATMPDGEPMRASAPTDVGAPRGTPDELIPGMETPLPSNDDTMLPTTPHLEGVQSGVRDLEKAVADARKALVDAQNSASLDTHPDMVDVHEFSQKSKEAWAGKGKPPGLDYVELTPKEAKGLGVDIEALVPRVPKVNHEGAVAAVVADPHARVILIPNFEDARGAEALVDRLDTVAKTAMVQKSGLESAYKPLIEASRETRGRFPPAGPAAGPKGAPITVETEQELAGGKPKVVEGYPALRARHAAEEQALNSMLASAGLPGQVPHTMTKEQADAVRNAILGYHGGRPPGADAAVSQLAEKAGVTPQLKLVEGAHAADELTKIGQMPSGRVSSRGGLIGSVPARMVRFHLDPMFQSMAGMSGVKAPLGAAGQFALPKPEEQGTMSQEETTQVLGLSNNLRRIREHTPQALMY